jgi:hypothetical protein
MLSKLTRRRAAVATIAILAATACSRSGSGVLPAQPLDSGPLSIDRAVPAKEYSILKMLTKEAVVGSTIDAQFRTLNPHGLAVAPVTAGDLKKGDLVVCNFNDPANVQGTGFTIVALHPDQKPGFNPNLIAAKGVLFGCDALALGPADDIWAAVFSVNDNPVISPDGRVEHNIKGKPFNRPFGQIFAQPISGNAAFYESNAGDGTVVRINLGSKFTFDVIAKGFAVNHGMPGSIFGPSGLAYDAGIDTLYIVDGTNNTVVAFSNVSKIPNGGIIVEKGGKTFKGPSAKDARLLFAGAPLNGPISSALFANGNLAVGNTTNPSGQNIIVEIARNGKVLATRNVDKGAAGAIFGMVATGRSAADTKLYFNDDNANEVEVLEH